MRDLADSTIPSRAAIAKMLDDPNAEDVIPQTAYGRFFAMIHLANLVCESWSDEVLKRRIDNALLILVKQPIDYATMAFKSIIDPPAGGKLKKIVCAKKSPNYPAFAAYAKAQSQKANSEKTSDIIHA